MTQRRTSEPDDDALRRVYGAVIADAAGPHLTEDDWVRMASDEVLDDERARFADHIAACAACASTWRVLREVRAEASAFDPGAPVPVTAVRSWVIGRWAGLAAAAVLVLAVATTVQQRRGDSTIAPATQVPGPAPAPDANVPSPAPVPAPGPAPRAWAALPVAPPVTLPASLALTVRGAAGDRDTFLAAFGPAITPYREGRYAEAATALAALSARYESVPEVWFYLGVSQLLSGRPTDAAAALERATASDAVGAQAVWLRVVALERAGRVDEASAALRVSCATASLDAHRAACGTLAPSR